MKARKKGESEWKDYKEVFGEHGEFLGLETAGYTKSVDDIVKEHGIDLDKNPYIKSRLKPEYVSRVLPLECFDLWTKEDDASERLRQEFKDYQGQGQLFYVNEWKEFRKEVAKFAMMGILSNWGKGFAGKSDEIPQKAVEFADALIEQLKREK